MAALGNPSLANPGLQVNVNTGYTPVKYVKYFSTLFLNNLVFYISEIGRLILTFLGIQWKSRWEWWNFIPLPNNPLAKIYLGALPLERTFLACKNRNDASQLKKLGIQNVLSITETFELEPKSCFFKPVSRQRWAEEQILQFQIATPDFGGISQENIQRGVEYIRECVEQNRALYIHCKAGRGRSFLILVCYLIQYQNKTIQEAVDWVRRQRPQASFDEPKWECARAFAASIPNRA